jgi:hypothetical protein
MAAWDAMAESGPAPMVAPASLTTHQAAAAKRVLTSPGAPGRQHVPDLVPAACRDWRAGGRGEMSRALFAPFGHGLSDAQKDAAVAVLEAHPDYACDLWDAAMARATRR